MATSNPVPSTSAEDLLFNAQLLDEALNSSALTFVDRLGVTRSTVAGALAEFPNAAAHDAAAEASALAAEAALSTMESTIAAATADATADAIASATSASAASEAAAAASAADAATSADEAETAADAATLAAGVYLNTAAGIAATSSGEYFSVPSGDANESLILYRNSSGTAVESKRYPSSVGLENPRAESLADTTVVRVLIPTGGTYIGGGGATTGAFKIKLPVGAPSDRNISIDVTIMDNYGTLKLHIVGVNAAGVWYYTKATVVSDHSILPRPNIRWGHDGTSDCIWIGDVAYANWAYPQVWIDRVSIGQNPAINSPFATGWAISLVGSYNTVTAGPTLSARAMNSTNPTFDGTLNAGTVDFPFAAGSTHLGYQAGAVSTGSSRYNTFCGYQSGALVTSGYHNAFYGFQSGAEATTAFANAAIGLQSLQHLTTGSYNFGASIHALLTCTTGIANNAIGAGALQYLTSGGSNNAIGMYAGRDTLGSGNLFLGHHAGINSNSSNELWVSNAETQNLIRGHFTNNRIWVAGGSDDGVNELQVNGSLRFRPDASSTPVSNGDLTFEATSNTSLRIRFKGSDGTVRSAVLALS